MTDVFLSYTRADEERVRYIHDALQLLGYDVFWDQLNPAAGDWDTIIRKKISDAKIAVVHWSETSQASKNVRHEAKIASEQGKLCSVIIDPMKESDLPLGQYCDQAIKLVGWLGDTDHPEWRKLQTLVEARVEPHAPKWVLRRLHLLEAKLKAADASAGQARSQRDHLESQIDSDARSAADAQHKLDQASRETAITKQQLEATRNEMAIMVRRLNEQHISAEALQRHVKHVEAKNRELRQSASSVEANRSIAISQEPAKNPQTKPASQSAKTAMMFGDLPQWYNITLMDCWLLIATGVLAVLLGAGNFADLGMIPRQHFGMFALCIGFALVALGVSLMVRRAHNGGVATGVQIANGKRSAD